MTTWVEYFSSAELQFMGYCLLMYTIPVVDKRWSAGHWTNSKQNFLLSGQISHLSLKCPIRASLEVAHTYKIPALSQQPKQKNPIVGVSRHAMAALAPRHHTHLSQTTLLSHIAPLVRLCTGSFALLGHAPGFGTTCNLLLPFLL